MGVSETATRGGTATARLTANRLPYRHDLDGHCPAVIGNVHVYRDGNHLRVPYAYSLAPLLWEEISEFL